MADNQTPVATTAKRTFQATASCTNYSHVTGVTLALTYVLMLLEAYTNAIGAGLSCPDWPTCYGTVVPFCHPEIVANAPYSAWQIFAEWAHRGLAMIVGVFILGTTLAAWRFRCNQPIVTWSAIALLALPVQVALGRFTVTELLQPVIVTAHLGAAVVILLGLTLTTVSPWLYEHNE